MTKHEIVKIANLAMQMSMGELAIFKIESIEIQIDITLPNLSSL